MCTSLRLQGMPASLRFSGYRNIYIGWLLGIFLSLQGQHIGGNHFSRTSCYSGPFFCQPLPLFRTLVIAGVLSDNPGPPSLTSAVHQSESPVLAQGGRALGLHSGALPGHRAYHVGTHTGKTHCWVCISEHAQSSGPLSTCSERTVDTDTSA